VELYTIDFDAISRGEQLDGLDRACQEWGFFELRNAPIPTALREEMLQQMARFFSLPTAQKRQCERTKQNHWGFYDRELTKNVQDWKELYDVGPEHGQCLPQWPAQEPQFRSTTERFYAACEATAVALVGCLAETLGAKREALTSGFQDHTSYLRLNYYPICPNPAPADTPTGAQNGQLGISHHSDAGAVTVLLQDGMSGLQVERDGKWYSISAERSSIIVNIGDIVQVWSNDRYQAPLHRVLANTHRVRYSAPFFLNPAFATDYAPLPSTLGNDPARYRPINWGAFRAGRAKGDYADYGDEVQIADYRISS
jgi:isopenicillin N synthase-like dioxygenase